MRSAYMGLFALAFISAACSRPSDHGEGAPAPSAGAPAPHHDGTLAVGEPITQPLVALADIAEHPARYASRVVATSGKVTAVCQEMGCWMEMEDQSGRAHVRMHGHAFFVPKSASGHVARVQATIVSPAGESDCTEGATASSRSKVELDATGVELD